MGDGDGRRASKKLEKEQLEDGSVSLKESQDGMEVEFHKGGPRGEQPEARS